MYDEEVELIMSTMFKMRKLNKRLFNFNKLNPSEMDVLRIIKFMDDENPDVHNVQMSEISNRMHITKPALTQIINKFEESDLVERFYLKSDRRATYIKLTEKGNQLFENEKKYLCAAIKNILEKMGEEDSKEFARLIKKFFKIISDERGGFEC